MATEVERFNISQFHRKAVGLPYKGGLVLVPFLHF